nr:SpoIIE family protein phosphatase [Solirubrobacterales bacterium]
ELLEREANRARTEELLHAAAQQMTASLDVDAVYASVVEQAARISGAPAAVLLRVDAITQTLRAVAATGCADGMTRSRLRLDEGAVARVARDGEAHICRAENSDELLPWVAGKGIRAAIHVPIGLGPKRAGMLSVGHPDAGALGEREVALLQSLARPAAGAIANALEFQHEQRIAKALTRGFIPDTAPDLDGFDLGLVYEPAGHDLSGGDIFGFWRLPGGALAVLVGDVSGKGLEVAAVSAMVRFFIEARTWDSGRPSTVLEQTNAILRSRLPGGVGLVTAFLGIVDDGVLCYANAGHVPPVVVGRDHEPLELRKTGLPLGVQDSTRFAHRELEFGAGELLFASTDGLTEARRNGEQFGQTRLTKLVGEHAATLSPQALVELAYASALAWTPQLTDDVAIIALRPR